MSVRSFVPFRHGRRPTWRAAATIGLGVLALTVAAWIEVPMTPVPMTLQTYAVLVIGALCGRRLGLGTVATYLAAAAMGLPVLAGGASGLSKLVGPTGGYLTGFAVTVFVVGWLAERGWTVQGVWKSVSVMIIGHALTLGIGVSWLATHQGWTTGWRAGLEPFFLGALVKSLLASGTVEVLRRVLGRGPGSPDG